MEAVEGRIQAHFGCGGAAHEITDAHQIVSRRRESETPSRPAPVLTTEEIADLLNVSQPMGEAS